MAATTGKDVVAPAETSVTFPVTGMTCAACQSFVEKTLREQPGVRDASVSLMLHNATVSYSPGQVDPLQLVEAVRDVGYGAELTAPSASVLEEQEQHDLRQMGEYRAMRTKALV